MFKVGVIGVGFVGTAVSTGFEAVLGDKIEIREYDKFKNTESLEEVVKHSSVLFVCLPTPMDFDTGKCDTSIVEDGIREIDGIQKGKYIVIKSTVPPGTTKRIAKQFPYQTFIFNPEFLTEKNFIKDFIEQDRVLLGYTTDIVLRPDKVYSLYEEFFKQRKSPTRIYIADSSVCEMTKYMGNAFLSTKVSFCNEMKEICEASNINYEEVADLVALDKRIGYSHMKVPGHDGKHGFGGSCFPKDISALIKFAKDHEIDPMIVESVWTKNLLIREEYEWEKLAQVNGQYEKK